MQTKITLLDADFDARFEKNSSGYSMPFFSYHELYEIYILETGSRTTVINDKMYETNAMTAALFPANALHRSYGDIPYSGICFHFSEKYIDAYYSGISKQQILSCFKNPIIHLNNNEMNAVKQIAQQVAEKAKWKFLYIAELMRIMDMAAERIKEPPPPLNSAEYSSSKLSAVMDYINDNYTNIKNYTDICSVFDISESYLYHGFKKQTGMTISNYINSLRIQYVCNILRNDKSSRTSKYIAEVCGFESVSYFIRTFKKFMGCTPTEYKDKLS